MITYQEIATATGTQVPPHLEAQAAIPITPPAKGARQGDVYVVPTTGHLVGETVPLTGTGHKVVSGDADRNSHILNGDGTFTAGVVSDRVADYGLLVVPEGGTAYITHTAEHGSIGFGPGRYRVFGQVSYETELRRSAD